MIFQKMISVLILVGGYFFIQRNKMYIGTPLFSVSILFFSITLFNILSVSSLCIHCLGFHNFHCPLNCAHCTRDFFVCLILFCFFKQVSIYVMVFYFSSHSFPNSTNSVFICLYWNMIIISSLKSNPCIKIFEQLFRHWRYHRFGSRPK